MRVKHALICLFWATAGSPVAADSFAVDAFGIRPLTATLDSRAQWSGLRVVMDGPAETQSLYPPQTATEILLNLGEKSMTAGKDEAQAAMLAFDSLGNLVADGQTVEFVLGPVKSTATLRNGLAYVPVFPGEKSGLFLGAASIGALQSSRVEYQVQADLSQITPNFKETQSYFMPETLNAIESAQLFDSYGNVIEEGTGVAILIDHPQSSSVLAGVALAGRVETTVLTRDFPSTGTAKLALGQMRSARSASVVVLPLNSVGTLKATGTSLTDIDATYFAFGPFLTDAGYLLNDGAKVTAQISSASGKTDTLSGWILDGYFGANSLLSPQEFPFDIEVSTVLGRQTLRVAAPTDPVIDSADPGVNP
jgi:uncharacterized Zn ribbon protein